MVQKNDYVVDGAMTDPKGDRGLAPSAQRDPDLFVHIVERREDGIVVSGAKGSPDRYYKFTLAHHHAYTGNEGS